MMWSNKKPIDIGFYWFYGFIDEEDRFQNNYSYVVVEVCYDVNKDEVFYRWYNKGNSLSADMLQGCWIKIYTPSGAISDQFNNVPSWQFDDNINED